MQTFLLFNQIKCVFGEVPIIRANVSKIINRPLPWWHAFNVKVWNLVSKILL